MRLGRFSVESKVKGAPCEIQVIPFGRHETPHGVFVLDQEGMEAVIAEFDSRKNDMVIDYEHQTLKDVEAPAAGWIKKLFAVLPGGSRGEGIPPRKEGLWAVVEWTDRAREYLKGREYRYLSPVFLKSVREDRVMRLVNAALTNQPAIDGMTPIVNKGVTPPIKKKEEGRMLERLLKLLGLPEDAGEEEAIEAVELLIEKLDAAPADAGTDANTAALPDEVLDALGLETGATVSEAAGTIAAMKQGSERAGELAKKVRELENEARRSEAGAAVARAMKEGKVTPAQKVWAHAYAERDPEGFRAFVAKAPAIVPLGDTDTGPAPYLAGAGVIDHTQAEVNRHLGLSDDTFRKYMKVKEV